MSHGPADRVAVLPSSRTRWVRALPFAYPATNGCGETRVASTNGHGGSGTKERVVKAAPTVEIGVSGLKMYGGQIHDEFHKNLRGNRAAKVYREMADNDPVVGGILFAIGMLLREIEWHAEPREENCSECDVEKDFVWDALNDMSMTWQQTLDAIISFLPYGWSYLETVYKIRGGPEEDDARRRSAFTDGRIGWRKMALRTQESLVRWDIDDNGGVQAMRQATATGERPIPIEQALLFRTTVARSNPEGRSMLRNAYRPWFFKAKIEEIEGIGVERDLAGLPVAGVPPEYLDEQADQARKDVLAEVKKIVRDIKSDEQQGIIYPRELDEQGNNLWSLELLSTGGRRAFDTDAIVSRYDQRIAMTVLADFILLGHEKVGSQSLGVSKIELFTTALKAWLDEVAAVMNDYGIPRLMRWNGVANQHWPKLAHAEVEKIDVEKFMKAVEMYARSGGVIDGELDAHVRDVLGFPQMDLEDVPL